MRKIKYKDYCLQIEEENNFTDVYVLKNDKQVVSVSFQPDVVDENIIEGIEECLLVIEQLQINNTSDELEY